MSEVALLAMALRRCRRCVMRADAAIETPDAAARRRPAGKLPPVEQAPAAAAARGAASDQSRASTAARCTASSAAAATRACWWCTAMRAWSATTASSNSCPTPRERSRCRKGACSRSSCARATAGPTASRSPPRISATTGRTWRTTRSSRPSGPPKDLLVDGEPPKFEVLSDNDGALHLAQAQSAFPAAPGRRVAAVHLPPGALPEAVPQEVLAEKVRKADAEGTAKRKWSAVHNRADNLYESDNPDLPTLQPWMNTTRPPADRFVAVRNPYFHRVDAARPPAALHRPRHPRGGRSAS